MLYTICAICVLTLCYNYVIINKNINNLPQIPLKAGDPMPMSDAHIRASRKYNEKAYDRIELKVPKGRKTAIQAVAETKGESLNGYVSKAIDERMDRDMAVSAFTVDTANHAPNNGGGAE